MSFKKFLKKHGLLSCLLAIPFLGMTAGSISQNVTLPTAECIQQFAESKCADLIAQRLQLAQAIATYKWNHQEPIISEKEQNLVKDMIAHSKIKIIDPVSLERFFNAQVDASHVVMIEHFEAWVAKGIDQHENVTDPALLQKKLEAIDEELLSVMNQMSSLFCGDKKEELKIALSKALYDYGFSRDVIDAATRF